MAKKKTSKKPKKAKKAKRKEIIKEWPSRPMTSEEWIKHTS